ncbi:MAG: CBU_0592 family membrane protein [Desulfopila sp.]
MQLNRIKSSSIRFSMLNAVGAFLILVSLYFDFNLSAFIIEFFWLLISAIGIAKHFWPRKHS